MSDIMLRGVIQMPYEMAMQDELSRRQFYARANQALAERDAQAAEIERLKSVANGFIDEIAEKSIQIERLRKALSDIADLYDTDEGCRSLPEYIAARAALSGEPNAYT